eukprot:m.220856 g.220856  ORF g.220856 m.220856 type:complete len:234 (-) comp10804_c0_seq10:15-716(-)
MYLKPSRTTLLRALCLCSKSPVVFVQVSHALCSLTPPACIYNHTPLDATLLLTQSFDQSERSTLRSPHWKDDFMLYRRRVFHKHMAVIIDVRGLENAQTLIPQGWTAIQVLSEMGFVRMGRFQLPLYHGAPSPQLLSDIGTMGVDKALKHHLDRKKIKFADGASVIVRVADPRRADTVPYDVWLLMTISRDSIICAQSHSCLLPSTRHLWRVNCRRFASLRLFPGPICLVSAF